MNTMNTNLIPNQQLYICYRSYRRVNRWFLLRLKNSIVFHYEMFCNYHAIEKKYGETDTDLIVRVLSNVFHRRFHVRCIRVICKQIKDAFDNLLDKQVKHFHTHYN